MQSLKRYTSINELKSVSKSNDLKKQVSPSYEKELVNFFNFLRSKSTKEDKRNTSK